MTEKQQAMQDAIAAIIQARQGGGGGRPLPPGEIDMPVDPNLIKLPGQDQLPPGVKIDDPQGLLKQKSKEQPQQLQDPKQPKGPEGPDEPQGPTDGDGPEGSQGGPEGPTGGDDPEGSQGPKGEQGGQGGEDDPEDELKGGEHGSDHGFSDDFAYAWNEMIDRYDKDEISDDEINLLIQKIKLETINEI